jgi:hypothetical protein
MNKKGLSLILIIFEIFVVLMVTFALVSKAKAVGSSDEPFMINAAEDLAMMVNVLVGLPGDSLVEYPYNMSNYLVTLEDYKVTISKGNEATQKISFFYLPAGYSALGFSDKEKESLCIEKKAKNILLRDCHES